MAIKDELDQLNQEIDNINLGIFKSRWKMKCSDMNDELFAIILMGAYKEWNWRNKDVSE